MLLQRLLRLWLVVVLGALPPLLHGGGGGARGGAQRLAELVDDQLERATELELQAGKLAAAATEGDGDEVLVAAAAAVQAEAHAAYRAAIVIDPMDPAAYYHLGHALRALGPSTAAESVALFDTAVQLDPQNPAAASSLGYMLVAAPGSNDAAARHRRRGLQVLARGVQQGLWPASASTWQHPMEWLPVVPPPPPGTVQQQRAPYGCLLTPLERQSAAMGAEAVELLRRYTIQTEGLARPHGGWRDFELWRRCGFKPGTAGHGAAAAPPAGLTATCAALREMAAAAGGAIIHSATFSAISPGATLPSPWPSTAFASAFHCLCLGLPLPSPWPSTAFALAFHCLRLDLPLPFNWLDTA